VTCVLRSKGRLPGITVLLCLVRRLLHPPRVVAVSILGNMIGDIELDGGPTSALADICPATGHVCYWP